MKIIFGVILACSVLAGCTGANITSAKWDSGIGGTVQTRCEQLDMRNNAAMQATFAKYDGWKLIYISEYTTPNRVGTDAAVCFQRAQ